MMLERLKAQPVIISNIFYLVMKWSCTQSMPEDRNIYNLAALLDRAWIMKYVCEAPPYTWFRIETLGEAAMESLIMHHAVEKYYSKAYNEALAIYEPPASAAVFEQNIGLEAHIQRVMPIFVTLRNSDGEALVTAMLPPEGCDENDVRPIVVGVENADPYVQYEEAIYALGAHYSLPLERRRCYPYV